MPVLTVLTGGLLARGLVHEQIVGHRGAENPRSRYANQRTRVRCAFVQHPIGLIGRAEELTLALSVLGGAGRTGALVLGGAAGVGKTTLVRAIAAHWQAGGHDTMWLAGAAALEQVPFGAVARLLGHGTSASEDAPMVGREAEVVGTAIRAARSAPHRLIVIDDAHAVDERSAIVIQQLVLDRSVPVALTVRTGEPVHGLLAALWRDGHATRVDLQPLGASETTDLAAQILDGEVEASTKAALFPASQGNPLLLCELLRDAHEGGSLRETPLGWRWDGSVGRARHLREVIGRRLESLDDKGRGSVLTLALCESLDEGLLHHVVPDYDLARAEAQGIVRLVESEGQRQVRLAHPLLGEVLIELTDGETLRRARLAAADALMGSSGGRGVILLEARLRLDADDHTRPDRLESAAATALTVGASDTGELLARAAVEAGGGPRARILLAESLLLDGHLDAAARELDGVLPALTADSDRVRVAFDLHMCHLGSGEDHLIEAVYERARPMVSDANWLAVLEGNAIQADMMRGNASAAMARGEALLAAHDSPAVRLRLVSSVGSGWALSGRSEKALAFVAEMLPEALRLQSELPVAPAWVITTQAQALLFAGRLEEAAALVGFLRSVVESGPWFGGHSLVALYSGRVDLAIGRPRSAAETLAAVIRGLERTDPGGVLPWVLSLYGEALALTGDIEAARHAVARADAIPSHVHIYDGDASRARAWVLALGGELSLAIDTLLEVSEQQRSSEQRGFELQALHDAARLGGVSAIGGRLEQTAREVDGQWAPAMELHVAGLRTGRGADLQAAGEAFVAMGARLLAAEAMAEAARAYTSVGSRTPAAASARRRDELLADLGPVSTPALQDSPARAGLTRREREVASLASQGLSNKEIATRLFLSTRTVEGHLLRAFTKLGVGDRRELTSALRELA